ncbi:Serine/threonine-protein kinase PknA [Stieleria bergensis]|uniref:Serine/threonine-protein kinase PknA n=1 Tax=Stieleria bergensis TaxID=2528025 RepID=A0A517SY34_9BACT|nr:Serine/threonine-protein kinase PknA [Planctomycetes bacterium SV_7m_r]
MASVFQDSAIASGLVTERQLRTVIERLQSDDDPSVAATLIKSGLITEYQAKQLHAGRTKLTLGPYLITDFIGEGGMGQVFKGVHDVMGRECAVKVLPREKSTEVSRKSFKREIRLQAGLDCPYVVRAYDAGQDGKVHYLVTEYVPGTDLRKLIRSHGALSMQDAALVISQAARGLQYAHDLGLIHRDVKPGNILVTPEGHAKVSDIGLATWSMGLDDDPRAGKVVGTADYLSPEQINDPGSIETTSDIYSLGCTLYYAVTGKVPFPGGDTKSKCKRHREQTPWHPRKFASDISEDFVDIIADMMEKDPSRRISTALEVAERLEPWCTTSFEVDRPIDRQAWTAPPIDASSGEPWPGESRELSSSGQHPSTPGAVPGDSHSGGYSDGNSGLVPPPLPSEAVDPSMWRRTEFPVAFAFGVVMGILIGIFAVLIIQRM